MRKVFIWPEFIYQALAVSRAASAPPCEALPLAAPGALNIFFAIAASDLGAAFKTPPGNGPLANRLRPSPGAKGEKMMKRFALAGLAALFAAPALATVDDVAFQVVPARGVTVAQLSQERLNWIASTMSAAYAKGIAEAQARYQQALSDVGRGIADRSAVETGQQLMDDEARASEQLDKDAVNARLNAMAWATAECKGLCYAIPIYRR
jgi:hypothetical protein